MVEVEHSAQPLVCVDFAVRKRIWAVGQFVSNPLVIALGIVVFEAFTNREFEMTFAEWYQSVQTLMFD
jgi:hypothetical protein